MTDDRRRFLERLAFYLIGIAIGLVMVGLLHQARRAATGEGAGSGIGRPPAVGVEREAGTRPETPAAAPSSSDLP